MIQDFVDKIVTINLDSRKDRWEHIQQEFLKLKINQYERFPAIKPIFENIDPYFYRNLIGGHKTSYKVATFGTKLSQLTCMWNAKIENNKSLLIVQDDATFREDTLEIFNLAVQELPNNWDVLYLTLHHRETPIQISKNICKVKGGQSSLAYITKPHMWDIYLNEAILSGTEMDVFARDYIQKKFNCYCISPNLAWDMPGYSDILNGYRDYRKVFLKTLS